MVDLVICEKPDAANKIATALADKKPEKKTYMKKIPYYEIQHKGKKIIVAAAVGHLYTVAEKDKGKWTYPVFNLEWKPSYEVAKGSAYTKQYLDNLKKLGKEADTFVNACDYDIEGEVIGLNIIKFACNQKDARRMKYSTFTTEELINSYENAEKHLDWGQAEAGLTRHELDYLYGINLSRALTLSVKNATGRFKILSTGRVQGPALKILAEKELEIKKFIPIKYWQLELKTKEVDAWHHEDKLWEKEKADKIYHKCKGHKATVTKISNKEFKQDPPHPFDLTTLQTEAYRTLKINPKDSLAVAQDLYIGSYISYPRTSSNQIPPQIDVKKILEKIKKQKEFSKEVEFVLKNTKLKPNNGNKVDAAHPAIHPTGEYPKALSGRHKVIYELITRRFLSTFGESAVRETMRVEIDVNKEIFVASGTRTKVANWFELYGRFVMLKEEELPILKEKQELHIKELLQHEKETKPPRRYTPASIIKELENRNLGTKATRAQIIDNLYSRNYVKEQSLEVTDLGLKTISVLDKYSPKILDEALTRHFEEEMEQIRTKKIKGEKVLEEARALLTIMLADFKKHEKVIGLELEEANRETLSEESRLGLCPNCKQGSLHIRSGKFGRFVACERHPECKTTFSLPKSGLVLAAKQDCQSCSYPMVKIIKKGKRPQIVCINPLCPSKDIQNKELSKEVKEIEAGIVEKECPKCKEGKLVLRKSVYGQFFGCSRFPKCRYTERLNDMPKKEDFKKPKKENLKKKV
ncbi:DNA topoisomerase I [Candidatus Woesearchaeota archaeon]|nr:DNA topoisomerase I [Candidatus Woesearchaeota archaeon]